MYKQLIIARKDLHMSPGKLAAQVAHASIAFLSQPIRERNWNNGHVELWLDEEVINEWFKGSFTKVICEAKNKKQLMKAVTWAQEHAFAEGKDYFLIRDNCLTELIPEEDGRTLTCIGFKPMDDSIIGQLSKKYQLYKEDPAAGRNCSGCFGAADNDCQRCGGVS